MRTLVLLLLLVAPASVDAAAPPAPKPPVSRSGFWEIDFSPLVGHVRDREFTLTITIEPKDRSRRGLTITTQHAVTVDVPHIIDFQTQIMWMFNRQVDCCGTGTALLFQPRRGEWACIGGHPIGEIKVVTVGLDEKLIPVVKRPRNEIPIIYGHDKAGKAEVKHDSRGP